MEILIVEDMDIARKIAVMLLQQYGCIITEATNGQQAFDYLKSQEFDLVLLDLGLPDMDGKLVAKNVRATNGKNSQTPFIALTAHSNDAIRQDCLAAGINDFHTKPLTAEIADVIIQKYTRVC